MKSVALSLVFFVVVLLLFPAQQQTTAQQPPTSSRVDTATQLKNWTGGETTFTEDPCSNSLTLVDPTTLAIGATWGQTPCVVNTFGGQTMRMTAGATLKLKPGFPVTKFGQRYTGTVYIYLTTSGKIGVAARNQDFLECTGCELNSTLKNFPLFPSMAIPVGVWSVDDTAEPAHFEDVGNPILDEMTISVGDNVGVTYELFAGRTTLRLDKSSEPYRIVDPPSSPTGYCEPGTVASDDRYFYRCVHVRTLYLQDGRLYRWSRTPIELNW